MDGGQTLTSDKHHCMSRSGFADANFFCDRLQFEFEQYACVWILERNLNTENDRRGFLALIHGVHPGGGEEGGCSIPDAHVSVTKYTYLRNDDPSALFDCSNNTLPIGGSERMELLLHFSRFESMGTQYDAEVIVLDDIIEARGLPPDFDVFHCANPPALDNSRGRAFCRFARSVTDRGMAFVPLAPGLLPPQERRNRRKLDHFVKGSVPYVVDFTPGVLGPAEGFVEAGYRVLSGLGFDGQSHYTWRVCDCPVPQPQGKAGWQK